MEWRDWGRMKVIDGIKRRPWVSAGAVVAALIAVFAASVGIKAPRSDRDWVENLAYMPKIDQSADGFSLDPVMDWSYKS